jgi:hypothetical protein
MTAQMSLPENQLPEGVHALRTDLLAEGGPRISTMRNHPFAILPYPPAREFDLRKLIHNLAAELRASGWGVESLDLHQLLLDRVAREGQDFEQSIMRRERLLFARDPLRALDYLTDTLADFVEGTEGIAADVVARIDTFAERHRERLDKTVVFIGRIGALYPMMRSSALLKHIAGKTRGIPVVLLYPGTRVDMTGLKFMDIQQPDRDYRPRIYP